MWCLEEVLIAVSGVEISVDQAHNQKSKQTKGKNLKAKKRQVYIHVLLSVFFKCVLPCKEEELKIM